MNEIDGRHREAAQQHPHPQTKGIKFTEQNPALVMLYEDAKQGQLDKDSLEQLDPAHLHWLAGHTLEPTDPKFPDEEWSRLRANAARARDLVEERSQNKRNRKLVLSNVVVGCVTAVALVISALINVFLDNEPVSTTAATPVPSISAPAAVN